MLRQRESLRGKRRSRTSNGQLDHTFHISTDLKTKPSAARTLERSATGPIVSNTKKMTSINRWSRLAMWLVLSAITILACSVNLPSARLDGEYLPMGNDSFYHARRILDGAQDPSAFYQFDTHIHAPEGSLLVWPWGYDYALAWIVRIGVHAGISSDPMAILIWIPVAAVLLSMAALLSIARRLELPPWLTVLAGLCMGLAPTTQELHGVGAIDHHYAELIFILTALASGLAWLTQPERVGRAAALGLTLGVAPAIHNGLFVLQLPLLACLFAFWLQQRRLPLRASIVFATVLLFATLAIAIPSLPFRLWRFEFYTLSWFHLYAATCTALVVAFMSWREFSRRSMAALFAGSAVLLVPIVGEMHIAQSFIAGSPYYLAAIGEVQSPLRLAKLFGTDYVTQSYSYLVWIAPFTAVLCAIQCWSDRTSTRLLFWITALMGLAMLSTQQRMHYFGDFALYMPWLVLLNDFVWQRPEWRKQAFLAVSLVLLLLYAPVLRYRLTAPLPRGLDMSFENLRPILETMRRQCSREPGIVLADNDAGHYIRYYTQCSVIANNFLLTPQQFAKTDEVLHLFSLHASDMLSAAPLVKYVLIRPFKIGPGPGGKLRYTFVVPEPLLAHDLLLGRDDAIPQQYTLLDEVRFAQLGNAPYARFFQIHRTADALRPQPPADPPQAE